MLRVPFLSGVLLRQVAFLGGGTTAVPHGLGRAPSGYFVTRSYAGGYTSLRENGPMDANTITFISNNTCTCDLWIW